MVYLYAFFALFAISAEPDHVLPDRLTIVVALLNISRGHSVVARPAPGPSRWRRLGATR
jgi:hypothetical protein